MSTHAFGSFGDKPPIQTAKKEEEAPELDPVSKQSVIPSLMLKSGMFTHNTLLSFRAALANEKRRRRRESHNAVERRRRDNINEKISELATLIPECLLDPAITTNGPSANGNNKEMGIEVRRDIPSCMCIMNVFCRSSQPWVALQAMMIRKSPLPLRQIRA
jgi:hypothetical protein